VKDAFAKRLSFGSLEIEVAIEQNKFTQVIDNKT